MKAAIAAIPAHAWKAFRDGEIAETVHCMNKTKKAFRLIVMRQAQTPDLFAEHSPWRYHAIASNRADEDAQATLSWYNQRGEASENRIKALKSGFRASALGGGWERAQVETVRWRLFQTAGKIIRHGRQVFLKISGEALDIFVMIRERCARILAEGGAVPETS